jgi:iron complex transport system ATP-binding protein
MMFLEAKAVSFSWGAAKILRDVSLSVNKNRFIGIIGPNGSGKSTFLKCIYRVLKPDAGSICLEQTPLDELTPRQSAKKLSVVAQRNQYDFDFTVRDIVLMGRSPHKKMMQRDTAQDYAIVRAALARVGLSEMETRPFAALSGGEQQRVLLARALAQETPALILDEPTNHLDIKYQLHLLGTVRALNKTVIAAFHDLNIAAMYCDEIYVLKEGRIYTHGTPEAVLTRQMIKDVYDVDATIHKGENGALFVHYRA